MGSCDQWILRKQIHILMWHYSRCLYAYKFQFWWYFYHFLLVTGQSWQRIRVPCLKKRSSSWAWWQFIFFVYVIVRVRNKLTDGAFMRWCNNTFTHWCLKCRQGKYMPTLVPSQASIFGLAWQASYVCRKSMRTFANHENIQSVNVCLLINGILEKQYSVMGIYHRT